MVSTRLYGGEQIPPPPYIPPSPDPKLHGERELIIGCMLEVLSSPTNFEICEMASQLPSHLARVRWGRLIEKSRCSCW